MAHQQPPGKKEDSNGKEKSWPKAVKQPARGDGKEGKDDHADGEDASGTAPAPTEVINEGYKENLKG